ncbi:alpha/beta hydrolase [Salisediminibacterium beveridgei]|uniref:Alpha/beta hydrolase family protein n=1 Tax=Salisediminibacterium beveridgei TaxID=632773 RepID=A0A1D7QWG3_9BACI|nr:alpha/beta hydrolase [Salisediminibacterium beveridgei]AOM83357.1 hypothetical protein BBEV_1997 [Salisediminibacterium beveridgei]
MVQKELEHFSKRHLVKQWFLNRIRLTNHFDPGGIKLSLGLFVTGLIVMILTAMGNPSGFGLAVDMLLHILVFSGVYWLGIYLLAALLSLLYLPIPRLTIAAVSGFYGVVWRIYSEGNLEGLFLHVVTAGWAVFGLLLGICLIILTRTKEDPILIRSGKLAIPAASMVFLVFFNPQADDLNPVSTMDHSKAAPIESVSNPAENGSETIRHFTYASGGDQHRDEFRHGMEIQTRSVDGSHYIDDWPDSRTFFFGFDESALPLNGRVWMPDTDEGPFPVVLIVHGNHRMEHFSDEGYEYLGEMLAKKGYAAVSVDQNFLNYSGYTGIPSENYLLRPWILMQHLLEFQRHQLAGADHAFRDFDLDQVSLIGHSRGGQAVSMVADHGRFFADDDSVNGIEMIDLRSVIAIAPTDRQIDEKRPRLSGVNYMTIHGAHDGDVHNFRGDRQFMRTDVSSNENMIHKASVYLTEGNHSQFNSDWGRADMSLPGGMFLNRKHLMSAEEQRQASEVFISAFLDLTIRDKRDYIALFQDAASGSDWLPDSGYLTRYQNSKSKPLVSFDAGTDEFAFREGGESRFEGFYETKVRQAEDRAGNTKATRGLVLGTRTGGVWEAELSPRIKNRLPEAGGAIGVSLANLGHELEDDGISANPWEDSLTMNFSVVMTNGETVTLSSDDIHAIYPPIYSQYSRYPELDQTMRGDKYTNPTEGIFHVYYFPLEKFREQSPRFQPSAIQSFLLEVEDGPAKIMVDWMNWYPEDE